MSRIMSKLHQYFIWKDSSEICYLPIEATYDDGLYRSDEDFVWGGKFIWKDNIGYACEKADESLVYVIIEEENEERAKELLMKWVCDTIEEFEEMLTDYINYRKVLEKKNET